MTQTSRHTEITRVSAASEGFSLPPVTMPSVTMPSIRMPSFALPGMQPRSAASPRRRAGFWSRLTGGALVLAMVAGLAGLAPAPASAGDTDYAAKARDLAGSALKQLAEDPLLIAALRAANASRSPADEAMLARLDQDWQQQLKSDDRPLIAAVLENPAAAMLRERIEGGQGLWLEAFATDAQGLNVAAAAPTSDYWQGDEAKFMETFPKGPDAMHLGEVEFDESTQSYVIQLSRTVTDPETSQPIGTLTVAVNADML